MGLSRRVLAEVPHRGHHGDSHGGHFDRGLLVRILESHIVVRKSGGDGRIARVAGCINHRPPRRCRPHRGGTYKK